MPGVHAAMMGYENWLYWNVMQVETDETFPDGWDEGGAPGEMEDLLDQLIAERDGFDLGEMRAERAVREHVQQESEAYLGLMPEAWPALTWNWDFSAEAQRYVHDGASPRNFAASYPAGLRLGWVRIEQFDAKLSHFNRRDGLGELWEVGDQRKLADAIAYSRQGRPLTPPMVAPLRTDKGGCAIEVYLVGGNHRYTVAKFSGVVDMPIYVDPELADAVAAIVPVRWADED